LRGAALDPGTGTITMRSLSDHLRRAVRRIAIQSSSSAETLAPSPPLGGPWAERPSTVGSTLRAPRGVATTDAPEDLVGAVLPGRFRIDRRLARGSFGTVYRARQLSIDRDVAVKVLNAGIDPASEEGRLFVQEIQSVGRIDHAHVVRIYHADIMLDGR